MPIIAIIVLIFAVVLLVLVIASPNNVTQRALNILFLIMIILLCLGAWPRVEGIFR